MVATFRDRPSDPYAALQTKTREHRRTHGCEAYTFEDGEGLVAISIKLRSARVIELGTALGYTACCLASGSPNTRVDTIESDPIHVELARQNIAEVSLSSRVTVHLGNFETVLKTFTSGYDLAFFDGFAPSTKILQSLLHLLTPGGVLVCANIGLAAPTETQRMRSMLDDLTVWQLLPSIEAGASVVRKKL